MKLVSLLLIFGAVSVFGVLYSRDDRTDTLKSSNEGKWGDWGDDEVYCDDGIYGRGLWLNVERPIDGDDTAADSFALVCDDRGNPYLATSNIYDAIWGTWALILCDKGEYIKGFKSKVESPGGDDTALNSIRILCTDNKELETDNGGPWGDWSGYDHCPKGSVVCGMNQKIEEKQGSGDDTALNAVRLECCYNEKVYSNARGYWQRVQGLGGSGEPIYAEITIGITEYSESSFSEENSYSLEQSLSASMSFSYGPFGGEVTASLTSGQSSTITSNTLHGLTKTIDKTYHVQCDPEDKALYIYITSVDETGANQDDDAFTITSRDYWCVSDYALKPQCPFIYCAETADDDCQTCTVTLGSSNIMDYYQPNTDNKYFKPQSPELPNENVIYFKISQQNLKILVIALIAMIIICVSIFVFCKIDANKNKPIVSYNKVENDSC